jgi:hypothetical protein
MGLLDCCCAPWRQVAPAPEDQAPTSSTESRTRATRNSELVENGMMLVELLSPAQQEELASAFRQFDVDGSGAMYAAQLPRSLTGPTRPHALKPAWVAVRVCVHSDSKEITAVLRQLGMFPNPEQVRAIMQALDVDGNGVIEWSEFSALMAHRWLGGQEVRAHHCGTSPSSLGVLLALSPLLAPTCRGSGSLTVALWPRPPPLPPMHRAAWTLSMRRRYSRRPAKWWT